MAYRVLVVDDEPSVCRSLSMVLERFGFEVTAAGDGLEALERFRRGLHDLVIADLKMPGLSGLELLREVKRLSPGTPVVLLTAFGTVETAVQAMKEGAFDFLQKPFGLEQLKDVVSRALRPKEEGGVERPIIAKSQRMLELLDMAKEAAQSVAPVLITGESGTGKELLARYIHAQGPRREGPFVAVNCAAIPEGLLESELFGHERGAFTGAVGQKKGKFELAHRGTLLLDEISEMPISLQAKLLRALQEGEVDRIGGTKPVKVDVRPIATSNRDLLQRIKEGKFREDLYFRLNVIHLHIPPLRERREDIPLLVHHFLEKYSRLNGRPLRELSPKAMKALLDYHWPGNVRELENVIHRAVLFSRGERIEERDLRLEREALTEEGHRTLSDLNLREAEKRLIVLALERAKGNRTEAARLLGVSVRTVRNKIKEYGLGGRFFAKEVEG